MALARLPVELIHTIAQHANVRSLASLARTCRSLQPTAERLLYRDLVLSSADCNLSAVVSVASRPALAAHVRTFSISFDANSPILRAFYTVLARALGTMSALTELHLKVDPAASWILDGLSQSNSFSFLHTFVCSFAFDASVSRFISYTPSLRHLELAPASPASPPEPVSSSAVPQLTHFAGSLIAAETLAPGRQLGSVHALDGDCTLGTLASLACAPLTILAVSTSEPVVPFLRALAVLAPTLAYLRLTAPLPISRDSVFPDIGFYEQVANALEALPHLVDFELAGMHWPSHTEQLSARRVWHSAPSTPRPSTPVLEMPQEFPEIDGDLYAELELLY